MDQLENKSLYEKLKNNHPKSNMEQVTSSITYKLDDLYKKITFLMVKMKSLHDIMSACC